MKTFGIILTLLGTFSIYCSHYNQNLLASPLPKIFKIIGLGLLLLALIVLLISLPKVVACFVWVVLMILVWSHIPFITLFKRRLNP
ncbi:hypothetical protein C9E89_016090 [Acinetobacter sichuanensis]|uniref:Uncharacterized protein n=1 Tax=Acinetobacter sichuanensis TaxID=2136183 RepID=A0A371YM25_9GAMM|nr:hypothetical protein C9E89_016090 [Acinetobacter sichuanensis]